MFKWEKLGKVFDPRDHDTGSWMTEFAQSPSVLVFEKHVQVYFCSRPAPAEDGQYLSYLAFIDLDRADLFRVVNICAAPLLSLGAPGTFDEHGTSPAFVVRHGDEVRVYYSGWTRCESVRFNAAIGVAVSHDNGDSFVRLGDGPVLSYGPDEPFLLGSPRVKLFAGTWYLWYTAGRQWLMTDGRPEPVYKIRVASSEDGINWTKCGRDLVESKLGDYECQASAEVTFLDGRYHMLFSYRRSHDYKAKEGSYRIGYASSVDMLEWSRCDEMAGIDVSESGWDSESVSYPHVFLLDGETYMLYVGNGMGRTGFGLARLQRPSRSVVA
jgi:predicted GH43/DUF377 family glycosyl hydrolase